jgi:signal transduction histidine kinase
MPANETERTLVLKQYEILLPTPDRTLDRITALAAHLFDVPVAVIGIVDSGHIRLVSSCGLETTEIGFAPEYPAITLLREAPYIVANTKVDTSLLTKTLATEVAGMEFYAGAPLITVGGFNLGSLWIIDRKPRVLNEKEFDSLQHLASLIMDRLESSLNLSQVLTQIIRNKDAARKTSLEQSEVISSMGHELRTPLNTILGFAQLMKMDNPPPTPSQKGNIEYILESGWYLLSLVNQAPSFCSDRIGEIIPVANAPIVVRHTRRVPNDD